MNTVFKITFMCVLTVIGNLAIADNAANYRGEFIKQCNDGDSDPQTAALCSCVFDEWLASLPDSSATSAVNAAKILSQVEGEYLPSELQQASVHMGQIQSYSMSCADKTYGAITIGGDQDNDYPMTSEHSIPNMPTTATNGDNVNEQKRGLFGAAVGWAGKKAGLPDVLNDAAADKADDNEGLIKSKLNPLNSKFNPFRKKKEETEE